MLNGDDEEVLIRLTRIPHAKVASIEFCCCCAVGFPVFKRNRGNPKFIPRLLHLDANEGIACGDIDGDGVKDLVAGRNWYKGGDWCCLGHYVISRIEWIRAKQRRLPVRYEW